MDFSHTEESLAQRRSDCIVAGVYEGRKLSPSAVAIDNTSRGALHKVLEQGDLEGELGATLLLHAVDGLATKRVLLVGLGPEGQFRESSYCTAVRAASQALARTGAVDATFCLHELPVPGRDEAWKIEQAVLALMDARYRFDQLKSEPPTSHALQKMAFQGAAQPAEVAIQRAVAIAEGIQLAKDLGNMPGNLCTPAYLADQAHAMARRHGFQVRVLEPQDIEQLGMGAFAAVARGSPEPAKLIVMEYRGGPPQSQPIALVGKGITFDAGGISIKPALEMDEMKFDMCGAASVFGALRAAALLKLPLNVVGLVPATENMPGGGAIKPGDVVKTLSGQTVEILDTDAEGRLVLCDALTYVARFRPAAVIDVATLTGEIVKALGDVATGLFANDDALARELLAAGDRAWDRAWQMPLWDEYQDALKSNFADLPNIGSHADSAVTAACFLSRFTKAYPWVHLDIAGTASRTGADKGATGRPVALLAHFLIGRAQGTIPQ